jgi:hypothetical protein
MHERCVKSRQKSVSVGASKRELITKPQRPYSVADFCDKVAGNCAYGKPLASISPTSSSVG